MVNEGEQMKITNDIIYKGRVLTLFEIEILDFVTRYELSNKRMPFLYEITYYTGSDDKSVAKSVKRIFKSYHTPLMVTKRDKELFDLFEEGMTLRDLSVRAGVTIFCARNHQIGIERLGAVFKPLKQPSSGVTRFKKDKEEKLVGIQITSGKHKGRYGYLNDELKAVIHIDGEEKIIKVESCEYREVRKAI